MSKKNIRKGVMSANAESADTHGLKAKLIAVGVPLGLLIIAVATMVPFIAGPGKPMGWFKYVYSAGAVILLICRLISPYRGSDIKLRRLFRIESWSALFFCIAAVFMFYEPRQMRDWIAFTLAGAVIQIFTSLAIPARKRKLLNRK